MKPKIQRHEHILTLVREHNFMTVEELAANLDVTPQTIRRDVQELSETGQLNAIMAAHLWATFQS